MMLMNIPSNRILTFMIIALCISLRISEICDLRRLGLYVPAETIMYNDNTRINYTRAPMESDSSVKNICPNLEVTCCTGPELEGSVKQYRAGYDLLKRHENLVENVSKLFAAIDKDGLIEYFEKLNSQLEHPKNGEYIEKFKKAVNKFYLDFPHYIEEFNKLSESIKLYHSGFICEFCSPQPENILKYHYGRDLLFTLKVSLASISSFGELKIKYYEFFNKLQSMKIIVKAFLGKETEFDFNGNNEELIKNITKLMHEMNYNCDESHKVVYTKNLYGKNGALSQPYMFKEMKADFVQAVNVFHEQGLIGDIDTMNEILNHGLPDTMIFFQSISSIISGTTDERKLNIRVAVKPTEGGFDMTAHRLKESIWKYGQSSTRLLVR